MFYRTLSPNCGIIQIMIIDSFVVFLTETSLPSNNIDLRFSDCDTGSVPL